MVGVDLFHGYNPRVLPQTVVQLTAAHIQGIDPPSALLEKAVGKAAGGSTDVQGRQPLRVYGKLLQCVGQLDAAAAHVGSLLCHGYGSIHGKGGAGLGHLLPIG